MAITEVCVTFQEAFLSAIQEELIASGLDGWLLYDFRGTNPIAAGVLGLPPLSRRVFVYLPARGRPVALTHRIEQAPWKGWIGENRAYLSWQALEHQLAGLLPPDGRVALEYSEGDAVPYLDRLPGGVLDIIRRGGTELISSGDLVSAFYSRWTAEGLASHERAARVLRDVAHGAFDLMGKRIREGASPTEWEIRQWIAAELMSRGVGVEADAVVAFGANAANPHYAPSAANPVRIERGQFVLIDLWGKESAAAIFADQTWMGFVGLEIPRRAQEIWEAIRDARDAAVDLIRRRHAAGEPVAGFEVDDVARGLIASRGHGDAFIHRTGHSIDRELHGSGPNIDNLETRDSRYLIRGIGFSIEPGIYHPGEIGMRTEIDVYMSPEGPVVTTPEPQQEVWKIDA